MSQLQVLVVCNVFDKKVEDSVFRFWRDWWRDIQVLTVGEKGVNKARNLGTIHAVGDIIYFLDDDCELSHPHQLQKIIDYHNKYPEVVAIGGGYLKADFESVYSSFYLANSNLWLENLCTKDDGQQLLGGNASYKRQVFDKGLKFDSDIVFGGAEVGLNQQILNGGGQIKVFDDLNVKHCVNLHIFKLCRKAYLQGKGRRRNQVRWGYKKGFDLRRADHFIPSPNWDELGIESANLGMKISWFCYQFFFKWGYYREAQMQSQ